MDGDYLISTPEGLPRFKAKIISPGTCQLVLLYQKKSNFINFTL